MIITVCTGFFIAGLTLLVLTMMSEYARTAIFKLQGIEEKLHTATTRVFNLTRQVDQKEQEVVAKQKEVIQKQREVSKKEAEYRLLTSKYMEIHKKLQNVLDQQAVVEKQLSDTQEQYELASSNLNQTKEDLSLAQERLNSLSQVNEDLKDQIAKLTLQETSLNQQIQNLETSLSVVKEKSQSVTDKPLIFYVGEILVATVTEPGGNSDLIFSRTVEPLLKKADTLALQRGARIAGKSVGTRVAPRRVAEVCNQLAVLKTRAVLRTVVEKNSVAGEPVTVTLEVFPNQMIFKRNDTIVNTEVNNSTPEAELRNQLLGMMILGINKAVEKGIITDNQKFMNLISVNEMNTIINQIKESHQEQITASLVAEEDIYRIDKLKVKFQLSKLN
jgi:uncharacterized protein (DUF3084 family)